MILSMTGYGKSNFTLNDIVYTIEIKSLNSKTTDIRCKLPSKFTDKEMQFRKTLTDGIVRGRIDFNIITGDESNTEEVAINSALLLKYFNEIKKLQSHISITDSDIFTAVMRIPSITDGHNKSITDEDFENVHKAVEEAIHDLNKFRIDEGKHLATELAQRVGQIQEYLKGVEKFEETRIIKLKDRIKKNLEDFITSEKIDENRFEQEVIYYLEKIDITEEKVRLGQHCTYFLEQLHNADTQVGKILSFISQEMGREINTLGSKAQDSDMQQIVVQMKDTLEKIKEQLANIL
jgi:uncharacterized protein (TIGR00255 family)